MSSSHSCSLSLLLCPSHSVSSPAAAALASNTPRCRGFSCCHPQGVTQTLLRQQQSTERVPFHCSHPSRSPGEMPASTVPPGSRAGGCGSAEGSPRVLLAGMVCELRAKGYFGVQRAGTAALLQDRWSSLWVLRRRNNAFSDSCRPHRAELPGPTQSGRMPTGAARLGKAS